MDPRTLAKRLASFELFAGAAPAELESFAAAVSVRVADAGEVLLVQGEADGWFLLVIDGEVAISRQGRVRRQSLGTCAPGAVIGELSMLTGNTHAATATAVGETTLAIGDADAFDALLAIGGVAEALTGVTSTRLAQIARPVDVTTRDGLALQFRPLLRSDRAALVAELDGLAPESRRLRFFSVGRPSQRMIDYLVNINYVDHFAWGVTLADGGRGIATARYVREETRDTAEVAFAVIDEFQGRGIGTLLLGALAAAAGNAGIATFRASVLSENVGMRTVFDRAGATWTRSGPGVIDASFPVADAALLVPDDLRAKFRRTSRGIVTGAGIAKHAD